MKPDAEDFSAAVEHGIIDARQADALREFFSARRQQPGKRTENFRIVNNFGEVFICIGQIMILSAIASVPLLFGVITLPVMAIVYWLMAEFFSFHKPRLAPTIVAALGFAALAARSYAIFAEGDLAGFWTLLMSGNYVFLLVLAVSLAIAFIRFRLPFLLLPLAVAATACVYFAASSMFPRLPYLVIFGACGIAILVAAIWLDSLDPLRQSRTTAYAFWLFVIGSPLTIHPLFFLVLSYDQFGTTVGVILGCALVATLLGLVLDRRSLVASSLIYFTISIGYMNSQFAADIATTVTVTALMIGTGVVLLGIFWYPLRSAIMRNLPRFAMFEKLPPYA
jgi:hypothetical protein